MPVCRRERLASEKGRVIMRRSRAFTNLLSGAVVVLGLSTVASAQWFDRGVSSGRTKADLDELRAEIRFDRGQWLLLVRYEVEIKRPQPAARFELVLTLTERSRPVVDAMGQPVVIGVPLARPANVNRKSDKVVFRDFVTVRLPDGIFHRPDDLRLEGRVIAVDFGRVLDRKNISVKFDRRAPRFDEMYDGFATMRSDPFDQRNPPRW